MGERLFAHPKRAISAVRPADRRHQHLRPNPSTRVTSPRTVGCAVRERGYPMEQEAASRAVVTMHLR